MILRESQLSAMAVWANTTSHENESVRTMSAGQKTSVFLSHKHDDIKALKQVAYILEQVNGDVYVDWLDQSMPPIPCGETASKIKAAINKYDKFILVATDGAIASKWCNWELGIGDAKKYIAGKIALFPIQKDNGNWSGSEYMQIYPTIEWYDGTTPNEIDYRCLDKGFYVIYHGKVGHIIPLSIWLAR